MRCRRLSTEGEVRLVKVRHAPEQAEEEMLAVVDLGGALLDVAVNHRAYGKAHGDARCQEPARCGAFHGRHSFGKSLRLYAP